MFTMTARRRSRVDVAFSIEEHAVRILESLDTLRTKSHLCDVAIVCGDRSIRAHRVVLSAFSSYFRAMFNSGMKEKDMSRIVLTNVNADALAALVNFAYTSKVDINEENVQAITEAAAILQLPQIVEACSSVMTQLLTPGNCLGICDFAHGHGCVDLKRTAEQFVMDCFVDVSQGEEFCLLPLNEVTNLLSSDILNVANEEQVFEAMLRWLQFDVTNRTQHISKLLKCIRLVHVDPVYLMDKVSKSDLFMKDPESQDLIFNALAYHAVKKSRPLYGNLSLVEPRKSLYGTLFILGGMNMGKGAVTIEYFNARRNKWQVVPGKRLSANMSSRRLQFGLAVLNSCVYVVGGRDGLRTLNTVDCLDPKTGVWSSVAPMATHRHGVSVATLCGPMYAVGGHDGWSYLSSVERYDIQTNSWSFVCSMSAVRSTAGVAVLNERLYVVGGRDSLSCLNSGEFYDPHTNKWSPMPPMSVGRGGLGVTALHGKLYAVGGHDSLQPLDSVEVFDPRTNQWTLIEAMKNLRDAVAVTSFGNKVFAIGGFNGSSYLDSVEYYDPETGEWVNNPRIQAGRAGAAVVVLPDLAPDTIATLDD